MYPPVIEAVRVPASACSTSQSTVIVRSPSRDRSVTLRSDRPIRRWISWVRPPGRPLFTSRGERSFVAAGSIEYSPVTHPLPVPFSQRGASSAHAGGTQDAGAPHREQHRARRPLLEAELPGDGAELVGGARVGAGHAPDLDREVLHRDVDRAVEGDRRLGARHLGIEVGRDVGEHQPLRAGGLRGLAGLRRAQVERHQVRGVLVGGLGQVQVGVARDVDRPRRTDRCPPCRPAPSRPPRCGSRAPARRCGSSRTPRTWNGPTSKVSPPRSVRKSNASAITLRPPSLTSRLASSMNPSGE